MLKQAFDRFQERIAKETALFDGARKVIVSRAPGRLDVMGGVADYSGSLVLEATVGSGSWVAIAPRQDKLVKVKTLLKDFSGDNEVEFPLADLVIDRPDKYPMVSHRFRSDSRKAWSALAAGGIAILSARKRLKPSHGVSILIGSEVPIGAGVASSAAVEVSCMNALSIVYGVNLDPSEMAALCQEQENYIAGAPCGIMDQMTSALGNTGKLFRLRCNPCTLDGHVDIPDGVQFFGINSGVKHSVGGGQYRRTRIGAFMALGILRKLGVIPEDGYLCMLHVDAYRPVRDKLPKRLTGAEYMKLYGNYPDTATVPDDDVEYAPRNSADHAVFENHRVEEFARYLSLAAKSRRPLVPAGKLMYGSHWSYTYRAMLGSRETDLLVRMLKDLGPDNGIYGAKITGGGCGGTVAVMASIGPNEIEESVLKPYYEATGKKPAVISGTSPGASQYGVKEIDLE